MKNRFLSFLCALLILSSLSWPLEVRAIDGLPDLTIYSPNMIDKLTVTWDPYPGAAYYYIDPIDEFPGDYYYNCEFEPEAVFSYWSCHAGSYNTVITAYNAAGNPIAKGRSGVYPYYPLGKMAVPTHPEWDGRTAIWDSVSGAESYKIMLYKDGVFSETFYISGQNYMDLAPYILDFDTDYSFRVAARRINYEISDNSVLSDANRGRMRRLAGNTRYETSRMVSEEVRTSLYGGYQPLEGIVLANGDKFPDALGGAYLSWDKMSPIVLINEYTVNETVDYIKNVVKAGSKIYVLGGEAAVSDSWLTPLKSSYTVRRLEGADRFETNLSILKESAGLAEKILICTGSNFADALSASAVRYPIMLVGSDGLTQSQKNYLKQSSLHSAVILGGTAAVTEAVENELNAYVTVEARLAGASRFDTSLLVANYFCGPLQKAVITTGMNFPDGLAGGLLAHLYNAPVILAANNFEDNKKISSFLAERYMFTTPGFQGYVLGGEAAVSEAALFEILNGYPY